MLPLAAPLRALHMLNGAEQIRRHEDTAWNQCNG